MFCPRILLFTTGMLLFSALTFTSAGNFTAEGSGCSLTDIDSRLSVAVDIIEATRRKLPIGLQNIDKKSVCQAELTNDSVCEKCPLAEQSVKCSKCRECSCVEKPIDCSDIYRINNHTNGIYYIWPQSRILKGSLSVLCDMATDGGGWTVIQRRGDFGNPADYFYRDWDAYKRGFGDLSKEFWIGNDNLFTLIGQRSYQLRIDLSDWEENDKFAKYDQFWIEDESRDYTLHVAGYSGNAGDSFSRQNRSAFSTKERDNDSDGTVNCADKYKGAWWYNNCMDSNLNGLYLKTGTHAYGESVIWKTFKGFTKSLKDTVMKIRPL